MRIIALSDIDGIEYSNVAGSSLDEYASATPYDTDNQVKVSFESDGTTPRFPVKEYVSLDNAHSGNYPPTSPAKWAEIGAENRCKMFDGFTNTQTTAATNIDVVIDASGHNAVGIFGIYGSFVTLRLVRDSETIKEETLDLRMPSGVIESGWFAWLFSAHEYGITQILWDFPRFVERSTLEIEITTRASEAMCGLVVVGVSKSLGLTEYGVRAGIDDYSIKDTDTLGRTYLAQGNFAKRADIEMWLDSKNFDYVSRQLSAVRGQAAIFDCNNYDDDAETDYQSLTIYGFAQNFEGVVPGYGKSKYNLEIKGLI